MFILVFLYYIAYNIIDFKKLLRKFLFHEIFQNHLNCIIRKITIKEFKCSFSNETSFIQ